MKRTLMLTSLVLLTAAAALAHPPRPRMPRIPRDPKPPTPVVPVVKPHHKSRVQLAILLDTSNSMDGLIDQARIQLWSIVNEFIYARRDGCAPMLEVALYEYGNDRLPAHKGHIRRVLPFTTDLDRVSEALFNLTTDGGSEYCGWVIQEAISHLDWDHDDRTLKTVFIAGNEAFTQGAVNYRISGSAALQHGILINTIHCGSERDGRRGQWDQGATVTRGRYLNINHNQAVVHIPAPQDDEIRVLNRQLNDTYIGYGRQGKQRMKMQSQQDQNASQLNEEAYLQRAVSKSSMNYRNESWDLVDALKEGTVELEKMELQQLPEELKKKTPAERKAYVNNKAGEREQIQKQIQELNQQRRNFLAQAQDKQQAQDNSLGTAIIQAIREQAQQKGFEFTEPNGIKGTKTENEGQK